MTPPIGAARAGLRSVQGDAIPDSVVSRPNDNKSTSDITGQSGLEIETKSVWPSIGARISDKTSGATEAQLRDNNASVIATVDISGLSSGDTFVFDGVDLAANTTYQITLDAGGSVYTPGINDTSEGQQSYPYTSDDVNITARIFDGNNPNEFAVIAVNDIGDTGF